MILTILAPLGYLILCGLIGHFGRRRKMGFWGYFFGSIVLTPVIGILLVLVSDRRQATSSQ